MDFRIFNNMLDGAIALNAQREPVYVNETAQHIFDLPAKRFMRAKDLRKVLKLEPDIFEHFDNPEAGGFRESYIEASFETKSGAKGMVQVSMQEVKMDHMDEPSFLLFFRDTSLEARLHEKYREEFEKKEEFITKLDRKLFETSLSFDISEGLHQQTSMAEIVSFINVNFKKSFDFDTCAILFDNEDVEDQIVLHCSSQGNNEEEIWQLPEDKSEWVTINKDQKPELWELKTSRELEMNEIVEWTSLIPQLKLERLTKVVVVPLVNKGIPMGIALLANPQERWKNIEEDHTFMMGLAQQLVLSVNAFRLHQKSIHDALTGLHNVGYFQARLKTEMARARRQDSPLCLILFDVDHFKKFNDTYGHQTGDQVLVTVGDVLRKNCRASDIPARYGGEEFAVILPDTKIQDGFLIADRLRKILADTPLDTKHGILNVTVSIGVSAYEDYNMPQAKIIELADKGLYKAKGAGRNRTRIYMQTTPQSESA